MADRNLEASAARGGELVVDVPKRGEIPPRPPLENYRVRIFRFGDWCEGSVISAGQANRDGNLSNHLKERTLEPTFDPVTVDSSQGLVPEAEAANNFMQLKAAQSKLEQATLERNRLEDENNRLNNGQRQRNQKLLDLQDENDRLKGICEEQDRRLKAAQAGDDEREKLKKLLADSDAKIESLYAQADVSKQKAEEMAANHRRELDAANKEVVALKDDLKKADAELASATAEKTKQAAELKELHAKLVHKK